MRPSRLWYAVAALIAVAGFVVAGFLLVKATSEFPVPKAEGRVGTELTVDLDQEGLTIFVSQRGYQVYCAVTDAAGNNVATQAPGLTETIGVGGRQWYVAERSLQPTPPGRYQVSCDSEQTSLLYAVGARTTVVGFVGTLFGAFGAAGLGFLVGSVIAIIVFFRRRAARRRLQPPFGQHPPYYGPPPGGPQPWPGA